MSDLSELGVLSSPRQPFDVLGRGRDADLKSCDNSLRLLEAEHVHVFGEHAFVDWVFLQIRRWRVVRPAKLP